LLQYDAAHRPQDCDAVRRRIAAIAPTPAVDALRGDGRLTKTIRRMVQQDQRARKAQTLQTTDVGTRADLPSHNLPLQVDRFVGRSRAIETLHRLIDRDARLITILGPGGAGKTRLASFFGRSILQGMPGGVWFCDLSEARACADVANAVARSMKLFVAEGDLLEQIGRQLATSGRSLLIVDNFEQVAACAQETIGRWRALAPDTIFLVTSRVHLGLSGEQLLPLAPLPEPEAISLFIERAQQRQPDFHQTTHNREDIQAIVQRLDGLPLAVELAAARVPLFGVQALRQQLSERLEILQDSRRPLRRHTNLHHAVQWSYDLLAPWEQSAFVQLSVFEGGFTLEAAEAILERSGWDPPQSAMDALQSLLDKSLLQRIPSTVHHLPPRFGMLASTQSFARTRLQADPMVNRLYRRHAAFYSSLVPIHVGRSHNGLSLRQRQVLFAEVDNLRAAQRRVTARDEPVMAGHLALVMTHYPRGDNMFTDRALALEQALDGIADQDMPHLKNHLLCSLASYRQMTGQLAQAEALLHAALQAAKQTAIPLIEGFTLLVVARFMSFCNRFKDARQRIQEAQAVFQSHHSHNGEAWAQLEIGRMWFKMGQMKHAATHARAALRLFQQTGDWKGEADACRDLGISILEIPNPEDAIPHFLRALQVFHESGFTVDEGRVSNDLGNCFRAMNRWQQAESYYRAALKIYRQSGDRFEEGVTLCNLGTSLNNRGKTEEAIKLFQRGLRIHRQIPNSRVLLSLLNNLSLLYASRKDYITAREMLEEAITQPNPKTQSRMIPMMRLNLGAILFKLDEPGAAAQYLQEAVSYAHSMEDAVLEGLSLAQLGLALGQLGHITRGRACFEQAEALLRPLRAPHRLLSLLCAKVIFEAPNDYAVASETFAEAERLMETFELNQNIHTANEIQEATHALQRHAPVTFADEHYA
ncbi:MAG: tetratricopeptide repeat protein, partial [Myxococcota bacterium]